MLAARRFALFCCLVLAAIGRLEAQTEITEFEFQGSALETDRSGAAGTKHLLNLKDNRGLQTISWDEAHDNPCYFEIRGRGLNNMGLEGNPYADFCHSGIVGQGGMRAAGFPSSNPVFISGLRVCMNGAGDRVKGIQVRGRELSTRGELSRVDNEPKEERTNCSAWRNWVECPGASVATGVILEFEAGKDPRSATGMRLQCMTVGAKQIKSWVPHLDGDSKVLEEVSGAKKGEAVDIVPGGKNALGLDLIEWAERRDNPCWVSVEGRDLTIKNVRDKQAVNKCGKADVEEKNNMTDSTFKFERANYFITGLQVCTNRGRIKGVKVEGKIPTSPDDPSPPLGDTRNSFGWQANCVFATVTDSYDGDWVKCPKGQVAVGLRTYFENGDLPRSAVGMTLICRPYK